MLSSKGKLALAGLCLAAFVLRLGFCAATTGLGGLTRRYREYVYVAERLVETGGFTSPLVPAEAASGPSALLPPAYALVVAAAYAALGGNSAAANGAVQCFNAVASSMAVVLVFLAVRRLAGDRAAWFAGVLAVFNPTLFGYTHLIWDTNLFILCVAITLWVCVSLARREFRHAHYFWLGLWLGTVALINPALTAVYPLLVLWPASRSASWRRRHLIGAASLALAGWLAAIAPWTYRNYHHFGQLTYIRNGLWLESWLGVFPEADADPAAVYRTRFPLMNEEVQRRVTAIGEPAYLKECQSAAQTAIAADPWRFLRLCAWRTVDFWFGTVYTHAPPGGSGWPTSAGRAMLAAFLSLETVALLVLSALRRSRPTELCWLLAVLPVFSLVYCLTHMQVRFRAPVEPIVAVLIASLLFCETRQTDHATAGATRT